MRTNVQPDSTVQYRFADADGVRVFYREAGDASLPTMLLLHGYPSSSHQFRHLIPQLAQRFHVIAPDLPGFGFTEVPASRGYRYTFDDLAKTLEAFVDAVGLQRYAMYVFDYGAPTGLRLAVAHPERVTGLVSQNGNAYLEGLGDAWAPIRNYWADPSAPTARSWPTRCCISKGPGGSTCTAWQTRTASRPSPMRWTRRCWSAPATRISSSTCSSITRTTSSNTRPSRHSSATHKFRRW
ncbi:MULTISPECIES: alpha/beta fold hydrolase [unclassified Cupriavidus]|uniref:alpha/beta fold hydrolase n=1 Tax=unclassified Cupriavidus TaxID=2640874 RepID=UPI00313B3935